MPSVSLSSSQAADRIADSAWTGASNTPISFGFRSTDSGNASFVRFTAAQIAATEKALAMLQDVASITFVRTGSGYTNDATMLFQGDRSGGDYAYAYHPGSRSSAALDGDVFINPSNGDFTDLSFGSYDFMAIMHEIGHAIGLDHPGAYNGGNPSYAANAEYIEDSRQYTLMSYFDAEETGAFHGFTYASTPLVHDIAAAQLLYGANYATRAGNTVYGFNSNADKSQFKLTSSQDWVVFAVWDGGGSDTLDFSGYTVAGRINLNAGAFSNVGGLTGNVAIAFGAVIENAIGGSGNDVIVGNSADNRLWGKAGNDTLSGAGGNDILMAGLGRDIMTGGAGADDFDFNSVSEIGKTSATRDVIKDFIRNDDDINLATIDANGTASGNTAFTFLSAKGANFTGAKGQLHWYQQNVSGTANDKTIVEGDINGDRIADFQIELTGLITLSIADFIL